MATNSGHPKKVDFKRDQMNADFYMKFEAQYRGSRDLITERLGAYRPFLNPILRNDPGSRILDLGCGRGEWLELTSKMGFDATGVDLNDGMLAACRERGLKVFCADAIEYLKQCPDSSLSVISSFHLVEHLDFFQVITVIAESLRALKPGGLLIVETPNPDNIRVASKTFYFDPSHRKPIPSELLSFVANYLGAYRVKVLPLQESAAGHSPPENDIKLIDVFEGASQDYSVVCQKHGPAELMESIDLVFNEPRGVTFSELAVRYHEQIFSSIARERTARMSLEHSLLHEISAMQAELNRLKINPIRRALRSSRVFINKLRNLRK